MKKLLKLAAAVAMTVSCAAYGVSMEFLLAVKKGDLETVMKMLPNEKDINSTCEGFLPLNVAIHGLENQEKMVDLLIANGADVNVKDDKGKSPLHFAIFDSDANLNIINTLIAKGADINAEHLHMSPFEMAAARDNIPVAKLLLSKGFVPNLEKAGSVAAVFNSTRFMEFLLSRGLNVNAANNLRRATLLHAAVDGNAASMVKFLLSKGADVNAKNVDGMTPLQLAKAKNKALAVMVLSGEADEKYVDEDGSTLLHHAAAHDMADCVTKLLEKGVSVNVKNKVGMTPLHFAASNNSVNAAKILLEKGARQLKNAKGENPLHLAAKYNSAAVAELLLEKGAKVGVKDKDGYTPIVFAVENNHPEVAKVLLDHGADSDVYSKSGEGLGLDHKLIGYAIKKNYFDLFKTLVNAKDAKLNLNQQEILKILFWGRTPKNPICNYSYLSVAADRPRFIKELLPKLDKFNFIHGCGMALLLAAEKGNVEACKILLDHLNAIQGTGGEKITVNDLCVLVESYGRLHEMPCSPLAVAVATGNVDCAKLLIGAGADVNWRDGDGDTLLHKAVQAEKNNIALVKMLLDKGIKTNVSNYRGKKAIDLTKNEEIIELLDGED